MKNNLILKKKITFKNKIKNKYFPINKYTKNKLKKTISFYYYKFNYKDFKSLNNLYQHLKIQINEGYTQQSVEQTEFIKKISKNLNEILEIGFNAGHSAEIFLENNSSANVTSVDNSYWYYTEIGKKFLEYKFPNRFNFISVDSQKINQELTSTNKYDLIFIDGNHQFEYAFNDILSCRVYSHENTILILDDVTRSKSKNKIRSDGPSRAWNELIELGIIKETQYFEFWDGYSGCVLGKYINV